MITVQVDTRQVTAALGRLTEDVRARIRGVIVKDAPQLAARVRTKLNGEVLQSRTGRLLNSVKNEMVENASSIYGRVYSKGVPYAGIQEHGGQTRPHDIYPRNASALAFFWGKVGRNVVFAHVHHPGSKIPARPTFGAALKEMTPQIVQDLKGTVHW